MPKIDPSRAARADYHEYVAWDVPTRVFHWVNALAVLGLIATGLEILTGNLLGLSPAGKVSGDVLRRRSGTAGTGAGVAAEPSDPYRFQRDR